MKDHAAASHTPFHQVLLTERLQVTVTLADKIAIAAAAERRGVTVAAFVRGVLADILAREHAASAGGSTAAGPAVEQPISIVSAIAQILPDLQRRRDELALEEARFARMLEELIATSPAPP